MTGIFMDTGISRGRFRFDTVKETARTPAEVFGALKENVLRQLLSSSKANALSQAYDDRIDEYEKLTGERLPNPIDGWIKEAHPENVQNAPSAEPQILWFENKIEEARAKLPDDQKLGLTSRQDMEEFIRKNILDFDEKSKIAFENTSTTGKVAGVAGELVGFMHDPLILATLPAGWPSLAGRSFLQAMARVGLSEALIVGGSEAVIQPIVQEFRKEIGFEDAGFEAGLRNVIFAMGGGAIFGSVLAGLSKSGEKLLRRLRAINSGDSRVLAKELRDQTNPSKGDEALAGQLEKDANQVDDNPLWQGPEQKPLADIDKPPDEITELDITAREMRAEAQREHDARTIAADQAAEDGGLPTIQEEPAVPISGRVITQRADNAQSTAELVDPNTLNIDAKRFQFKSAVEEGGVTPRLKDVGEWDQTKAGLTLVWEDASGRRFIADGHQRVALARRLLKQNPDADIRLLGIIRKEVDDFTAEDVMVEAAMKNIAETDLVTPQLAIDAAIVMRIRPEDITELLKSLPPRSTMVKTVSGLINLSDRSFSHVINQKISATHAAMVARLVKEENLQDAIMDVLVREQVVRKTDIEAEAIIRQAREVGTRTDVQETLFGKEILETSLFSERAKVLQKTLQKLRKEKSVFRNLVKNKGKIESEGNALKTDINQQIADESAVAVELLMKLANRTGALSNALTDAARLAGETKKFGPAVDQFIDSVREAIARGDFEGLAVGGAGRAVKTPAQNRKDIEQRTAARDVEEVEGFDEVKPGAQGPEVQSRIFDEELEALEADPALADKKIPVEFTDPNTGRSVSSSITIKEIIKETKDDDGFLNGLAGCIRGK